MTPEELAELHALAFTEAPRPWTAAEFADLLAEPAIFLVAVLGGFALGRTAGPEAELLTLAVHPAVRRHGLGRALVRAFETRAAARGATECLLDVAETNAPARALYAALGYAPVGRRPRYYARAAGPAVDGLVLRRDLVHPEPDFI